MSWRQFSLLSCKAIHATAHRQSWIMCLMQMCIRDSHGINTAAIGADNNSHMVCGTIQIPIEEHGITGGDVFISSCAPLSMRLEPRNTLRLTTSKAWFRSTGLTIAP